MISPIILLKKNWIKTGKKETDRKRKRGEKEIMKEREGKKKARKQRTSD